MWFCCAGSNFGHYFCHGHPHGLSSGPDYDHAVQHDGQPGGHGQVVDFDQEPDHGEQVEHQGCGHGKVQSSTSTKTKTDGASDMRCKTNKNTKSAKPKM